MDLPGSHPTHAHYDVARADHPDADADEANDQVAANRNTTK